jgi:hypothetical protein
MQAGAQADIDDIGWPPGGAGAESRRRVSYVITRIRTSQLQVGDTLANQDRAIEGRRTTAGSAVVWPLRSYRSLPTLRASINSAQRRAFEPRPPTPRLAGAGSSASPPGHRRSGWSAVRSAARDPQHPTVEAISTGEVVEVHWPPTCPIRLDRVGLAYIGPDHERPSAR